MTGEIQSLESQGIPEVSFEDGISSKDKLKYLLKSINFNFIDLVTILTNNPTNPLKNDKLRDLNVLFFNFHHLINSYRPHQATESLKQITLKQIDENSNQSSKLEEICCDIETQLENLKMNLNLQY